MNTTNAGAALRAQRKFKTVITCEVCGVEKATTDPKTRYCSASCQQKAKYQRSKAKREVY